MGIMNKNNSVGVFFGYGDLAIGVVQAKEPVDKKNPKDVGPLKRALCLNQIKPGQQGRPVPPEEIDWEQPQVFIIFDRHETVDLMIDKLFQIKDTLKEAGL